MEMDWLENALHTSDITIEETDWGLSNRNWRVTADGKEYVLRTPGKTHQDFRKEIGISETVKDLDVPILAFDENTGYKLSVCIPGLREFKDNRTPEAARQVGAALRTLHQKPAPEEEFNPFVQYNLDAVPFPRKEEVLKAVKAMHKADTLCHNDLVSGNLLFGDRFWLIDYEYAGRNDARFDIASFFSENNITERDLRSAFYEGYGNTSESLDREVKLYELFEDILWAAWALQKYADTHDTVYQEIFNDKKSHYDKLMQNFKLGVELP